MNGIPLIGNQNQSGQQQEPPKRPPMMKTDCTKIVIGGETFYAPNIEDGGVSSFAAGYGVNCQLAYQCIEPSDSALGSAKIVIHRNLEVFYPYFRLSIVRKPDWWVKIKAEGIFDC